MVQYISFHFLSYVRRELGEELDIFPRMACFERASPALKEILLKLYRAEKPLEIDHHLYEFGSVEYHIKALASDPYHTYLSISTPLLSQGVLLSYRLSPYTIQMIKEVSSDVVEIVEPAKAGYQLTLRLDFTKIPRGKDSVKVIKEISTVQAVILSSQLKEMLQNVNSQDVYYGMYKPIKLVYHPREPFYVIRQLFAEEVFQLSRLHPTACSLPTLCSLPFMTHYTHEKTWLQETYKPQKITVVFPMRFKEYSDVIIATAFFQELMDVGSGKELAKAPPCCWSPIPPPELRGEPFEDLSTNGGFVSFDISSRHVEGKRLDKTVWSLLNFYAYVKHHIKCTRGFIQRRMRKRLDSLVEVLQKASLEEDEHINKVQETRYRCTRKLVSISKSKIFKQRCGEITRKIKRIRFRIKIHGFGRLRRRWLTISKCSSMRYTKLD